MILLGFKMNWPESSEATVQINILAPHYSLWDQEHLIFYYWDSGLKYPFLWPECAVITTVYGEYVHEFTDLSYANSSEPMFLCVSAQSFKEFSQLLNMVEEERRRLVRCFFFIIIIFKWKM